MDSRLSELKCKRAKLPPGKKRLTLFDGGGLYLLLTPTDSAPSGAKRWRFKYRFGGRERLLALGTYPTVGLKAARARHDAARALLRAGRDPGAERAAAKGAKTAALATSTGADAFAAVCDEWLAKHPDWVPSHRATVVARLRDYVLPKLGPRPVGDIDAAEVLEVLRAVEAKGIIESAHRTHQVISAVLRYAVATNRASDDISAHLRGALTTRKVRHHAAITKPGEVGALWRAIRDYEGTLVVRAAMKIVALTFVRSRELREATWSEFELDAATWTIPAARMKMRAEHIVPLSRAALEVLRELRPVTGAGRYVFPSPASSTKPLSENGIASALRRMDYAKDRMSTHGFRSMASTLLNELPEFRGDPIEAQLAHAPRDGVRDAYNRAAYLPERRRMMEVWAGMLDRLAADGGAATRLSETSPVPANSI